MAPRWRLFAGATIIVLLVVLGLSRATARELSGPRDSPSRQRARASGEDEHTQRDYPARAGDPDLRLGAAISQALVGAVLAGLAWYADVPAEAMGIDEPTGGIRSGVALGIALFAANEAGTWVAARFGMESDESLRGLLAPDTRVDWALLLFLVLPIVAGVEELLFRGALIGALAAGFPVSPWLLAVLSSVAFGLGHGLQGSGGVLVTGVLGFALAAAFVITGSLWVAIVAHYLVNALAFLVHEGIGVGWNGS